MRVSAVQKGIAPDIWTAIQNRIQDPGWRIDFGRLYEFAGGDPEGCAYLYGSRPPANDTLWNVAAAKGFQPVIYDRNVANKEKKIDTDIAASMIETSYEKMKAGQDTLTLVAGDADYVPVIERLAKRGFTVDVMFWKHASHELRDVATKFVELDSYLDHLNFYR